MRITKVGSVRDVIGTSYRRQFIRVCVCCIFPSLLYISLLSIMCVLEAVLVFHTAVLLKC